jgi:hypothetical protein
VLVEPRPYASDVCYFRNPPPTRAPTPPPAKAPRTKPPMANGAGCRHGSSKWHSPTPVTAPRKPMTAPPITAPSSQRVRGRRLESGAQTRGGSGWSLDDERITHGEIGNCLNVRSACAPPGRALTTSMPITASDKHRDILHAPKGLPGTCCSIWPRASGSPALQILRSPQLKRDCEGAPTERVRLPPRPQRPRSQTARPAFHAAAAPLPWPR